MELDHVKPNLVHELFWIQSIGIIPLEQFKEVLLAKVYKKCQSKSYKTLHSSTSKVFLEDMYKEWHISNSPKDFFPSIFNLFILAFVYSCNKKILQLGTSQSNCILKKFPYAWKRWLLRF
jgi:hypothetical protein